MCFSSWKFEILLLQVRIKFEIIPLTVGLENVEQMNIGHVVINVETALKDVEKENIFLSNYNFITFH